MIKILERHADLIRAYFDTVSASEAFYATLCHELVHWSGAKKRLDRDLSGRFGTESYAVEELVAELGSTLLCGDLGIAPEPCADHACYIKNWFSVLKSDKKATFTAASKASEAANWLLVFENSEKLWQNAADTSGRNL